MRRRPRSRTLRVPGFPRMTWSVPPPRAARSSQVPCGEDGVRRDLVMRSAGGGRGPEAAKAAGQRWDDAVRQEVDDEEEQCRVGDEVEVTGPEAVGEVLLGWADQGRAANRAPQSAPPAEERHQDGAEREQRVNGEARVEKGEVVRPYRPEGRREASADGEGDQLDQLGLHAEPSGAVLVVAHGVEREPELAGPRDP